MDKKTLNQLKYKLMPLEEGDEDFVEKRLDRPSPESYPLKEIKYKVEVGNEDDIEVICKGLDKHNQLYAPDEREEEVLGKRIVDENGELIAAYTAPIDGWSASYPSVWVEERYRNQGIGTYLLQYAEQELREKGAYIMQIWVNDWVADFFIKQGFTICTTSEDNPEGHRFYRMTKHL